MREAIEDCSTDFELGYLTLEGPRGDALAEQLEAVHLGFDQAASMVAAPLFPDGPAQSFHRAKRLVAGLDAGTVLGPGLAVAANRDDRIGTARIDGRVTPSGVIGPVAADGDNDFILGDLREQIRQRLAVTDGIARDLDRPDIEGFRVDADMLPKRHWRR